MEAADLAGFRDAQVRLRQQFGEPVPFFTPQPATYASGVVMDPESGVPMDPTIPALSSGFASAVVTASVVARPLGLSRRGVEYDVAQTAFGNLEEGTIVLIVGYDEWEAANLDAATEVEVHDERYEIEQTEQDQLGPGEPERMLAYCAQIRSLAGGTP